jgi:hypothetical protein
MAETDIPTVEELMKQKIAELQALAGEQTSSYIRLPNQPDRTPKTRNLWLILLIVAVIVALNISSFLKLFPSK